MHKIMFVCHGNICRSPMAEYLCKDFVFKSGREQEFVIASSAVSNENCWNGRGAPVYAPVKALLREKGINCDEKRACVLTASDGEKYDVFLCMDDSNVRRAKAILGAKNGEKCKKLLSYVGESGDVADPWYTDDYERAYQDIYRGLQAFLKTLG
ncbi:MAG: low molecular weight phosphotyrosine protein phosphatase [Clostridia bacterium]|nr:low molecular weight phosphotyrosine protein phosphatase [Clostridia bacterium]